MKVKQLFNQSVAGSATVNGTSIKPDWFHSDQSTAVLHLYTTGTYADITLFGRLIRDNNAWVSLTTGSSGQIQIVPRCTEYYIRVVNSSASSVTVKAEIGV